MKKKKKKKKMMMMMMMKSSDDDQSSSSTSDLDEESIKLINKVEKIIQKLNVKGVPIQIQDLIFTNQRNEQKKRGCYGCGELGHFVEVCPNKTTPKTKKKACVDRICSAVHQGVSCDGRFVGGGARN